MFKKNEKNKEKFKISKNDIDAIRKLGVISHSFDSNLKKKSEKKDILFENDNE